MDGYTEHTRAGCKGFTLAVASLMNSGDDAREAAFATAITAMSACIRAALVVGNATMKDIVAFRHNGDTSPQRVLAYKNGRVRTDAYPRVWQNADSLVFAFAEFA